MSISEPFLAYRIHRDDARVSGKLETLTIDQLSSGDTVINVEYSGINYKDALAATGAGRILRRFPLVGGIDLAGEVISSRDMRFKPGDRVVALSGGLGETRDGGYAERARVDADLLVPIPKDWDTRATMALGTAGFAAALAIHRLEHCGLRPAQGPVLVTGATGGVGSVAIDLLNARGYEVVALTGKIDRVPYLKGIGATEVLDRNTLEMGSKPLEHARWAGAIDNLGGEILAWLTRTMRPHGVIASIGLAASAELHTTVMPFILRAVSLLGINIEVGHKLRDEVWQRLTTDLRPRHLDAIAKTEATLAQLPALFGAYLDAQTVGRTVVRID